MTLGIRTHDLRAGNPVSSLVCFNLVVVPALLHTTVKAFMLEV
jgi:hypothetical protein